jgi:cytochrome c553
MKKILSGIVFIMVFSLHGVTAAGTWNTKCIMCHKDGNTMKAPTKAALLEKYKTPDAFKKAAKASKNPMMKNFQKDDLLNEAVMDLYK